MPKRSLLAVGVWLIAVLFILPKPVSASSCVTHSPPNICTGITLCAVVNCWNVTSVSQRWRDCQQYDYDGNCDIDVVDIMTCSSKCQLDGQEGSCCQPGNVCNPGLECQICFADAQIGNCVTCPKKEKGDLNCDSIINEIDLSMLLSRWGEAGLTPLQVLLDNWQI